MTREIPLVIVTGLPGSGKSSAARFLEKWRRVVRIRRYTTRPPRQFVQFGWKVTSRWNSLESRHDAKRLSEEKYSDGVRIPEEKYHRLKKDGKIFHPTETIFPDGTGYYRGFPPIEEWPAPLPNTEMRLLVCGPRAALEIYELLPNVVCVFLTASNLVLLDRILGRGGADKEAQWKKVAEYRDLGIEEKFRKMFGNDHVIDTDYLDIEQVARRIELIAGFNPLQLRLKSR